MKVLQRGIWEAERTCLGCSSVLMIEENDVNYSVAMSETLARNTPFYFTCPVCEHNNPLDHLPSFIVQKIINGFEKIK